MLRVIIIIHHSIVKVYIIGHRPVQNDTKYNLLNSTMLRVIIIIHHSIVKVYFIGHRYKTIQNTIY